MSTRDSNPAALDQASLPPAIPCDDTNGAPPQTRAQDANADQLSYEPVPARKRVTLSVHYRVRGRGRLLAYPLTEGDAE